MSRYTLVDLSTSNLLGGSLTTGRLDHWRFQPRDRNGRFASKPGSGDVVASGLSGILTTNRDRGAQVFSDAQQARKALYEAYGLRLKRPDVTDEDLLEEWETADRWTKPQLEEELRARMELLSRASDQIAAEHKRQAREKRRKKAAANDEILDATPGGGVIKALRDKLLSDGVLDFREKVWGFVKENALSYGISVATAVAISMLFSPLLGGISLGVFAGRGAAAVLEWPPVASAVDVLTGHFGVKAISTAAKRLARRRTGRVFSVKTPEV